MVVIDKERARDSKALEVVGTYSPVAKPRSVILKHDRIAHWMKNGAQPSDTVARLLRTNPAAAPAPAA
jgi:small subunit ribosomal protein S16